MLGRITQDPKSSSIALNEKLNVPTDIWAAGCVLYEMVSSPTSSTAVQEPPFTHIIFQRFGSPEILGWTQELGFEAAENTARAYLKEIAKRHRPRLTGT